MELMPGERIDFVNDDLSLIQKPDGLTFGTDALLLAGYIKGGYKIGAELGGGSGIISMLLSVRGKVKNISILEVQEEYCDLVRRNIEYNSLGGIECIECDVRLWQGGEKYDVVYTNPPYMGVESGYSNREGKKNIARHEVFGGIYDFLSAAARGLKYGGAFYAVYRTDRLSDLILAMRESKIEPKRMTLIAADTAAIPKLVLIEGKRGAAPGMLTTRGLFIYKDESHTEYTDDMNYIMSEGSFPRDFYIR